MIKYPLEIELTNYCSLKCISCISNNLDSRGFLLESTYNRILDFIILNSNYIDFLTIAGLGDIFIHPNIDKFLNKLEILKDSNIQILIPTKGNLLNEGLIKKIFYLKSVGVNINIQLGIFSLKEDRANFLTGLYNKEKKCFSINYFEKFKKTLKLLKKIGIDFSMELLLTKLSSDEIKSFYKFCNKLKVDGIIHKLHNFGGKLENYSKLYTDIEPETRSAGLNIKNKESKYYGDICGFYPFINYNGDIFPGTFCMHYKLGNINNFNGNMHDIVKNCYKIIDKSNKYCSYCTDNFI